MLPPVAAISSVSPVALQREITVVADALAGQAAAPDDAVALSLAVSTGVEGKLNMLLINARERMLDSLFAVIDAVSQSLAAPQQAGETNAAYAQRLADTVAALPPKQGAVLQQQLAAQGQAAPLSLVAAALRDPTGPQAAQLVAYLEVVRYKDKDLATKSVVASYGQNDGSTKPDASALETQARNAPAQAAAAANGATVQSQSRQPSGPLATPAATAPTDPHDYLPEEAANPPSTVATTVAEDEAGRSPPQPLPAAGNQAAATRADAAVAQALRSVAPKLAAAASELPLAAPAPTAEETTPRVILQIRSDVQEGLKVVFDRLVQATGTELLQTMAEAEPLADKVIAEALIADMIDGTEINGLPLADGNEAPAKLPTLASALSAFQAPDAAADTPAQMAATAQLLEDTAEAEPTAVPMPPLVVPPGLVVGFVTTPYAPAEDVLKDKDAMRVDRVDAVDDDEHEEPSGREQDGAPEDEAETSADEALDMLAPEPEAASAAEAPPASRSTLLALPRRSAEPLPDAVYNLYERMGA